MNPIDLPTIFVGRNEELQHLDKLVKKNKHRFTPIIITGVPGIGKTALVKVFIENYVKNYKVKTEVKWLSLFSSPEPEKIIDELVIDLKLNKSSDPTLVILDDAEGIISEMPQFTNKLFNFKRVENIIITTRHHALVKKLDGVEILNLQMLSSREASDLLKARLNQSITNEEAGKIAEMVDYNPLVLNILSGLSEKYTPRQLIALLQRKLYDLDSIEGTQPSQIIKIVQPQIIVTTSHIIKELKKFPEDIYKVTPRKFEEIIAEILSDMGCEVELTQATRDGGKDILAYVNTDFGKLLCLVETKLYRKDRTISVDIVRNLYGTFCDYEANSAMLVTTSKFSPDARQFQQRHKYQLSLKDYTDIVTWILKYKTK